MPVTRIRSAFIFQKDDFLFTLSFSFKFFLQICIFLFLYASAIFCFWLLAHFYILCSHNLCWSTDFGVGEALTVSHAHRVNNSGTSSDGGMSWMFSRRENHCRCIKKKWVATKLFVHVFAYISLLYKCLYSILSSHILNR